ncbi:MAG TPA: amino acid adenylation domain-containing protein, partial [Longimicrobiaceae bacterium]|nr:amino acid adenylation domain-containing protein [Longimicrobiaceae bacterium]
AHRLLADGLRRGDVVAVHARRSASLAWALLGVLGAGGAFLVLDPAYPGIRLARQLRAARPRVLLRLPESGPLAPEVEAWLADAGVAALSLPARAEAERSGLLAGHPTGAPPVEPGPDDLAYVAFTSGTTGEPKGIVGTHGPLAHFVAWQAAEFGLTADDRFAMLSGLAHDPLLRDVFTPLSLGATLCVPDPVELASPGYLARWLAAEGVTAAHLTPAMASLLGSGAPTALPALRHVFWGGDRVHGADVARLRPLAPHARSTVFYGATETPQAVGFHRVSGEPAEAEALPVGRGIEGVQLLVLARGGGLAGIGEVGEVCVRTPHLARGYLHDEAATRDRFVPNPLAGDPADRVYRTGDLGRFRPDGTVQVLGRADAQVKVRGFRVEPGEVEAALREHPSVREAAVVLRDMAAGPALVAYVVPATADGASFPPPPCGEGPGEGVLRDWLRDRLPDYMVPAAFVALDALPLTPNGKLDRRALPAPEAGTGAEHVAPRPGTEQALAEVWEEVLGVERVGAEDGFFALGGHSLLATRMVSRVREALGVELPLRALFEAPTLAGLAARVDALRQAGDAPALPPVRRVPREEGDGLPLSFAQQRLWFIHRMDPLSAAYHLSYPLRLRGDLDVRALRRSLDGLAARHETLRTVFPERAGGPVQVVLPPAPLHLPVADLRRLPEAARADAVRRLVAEEAARPFDLGAGPLLRVLLARAAEREWVLCFTLHHVVSDGWSMGVLTREVNELYRAHSGGAPARLPELPVQYADYAAWQREWLEGGDLEAQLAWWRGRLADAPPLLELPTDFPRRAAASAPAGTLPLRLPRETGAALRELCRREGATPFMGLLAAFALLLSKYSGQEDVVVGSPIAGRTRTELEPLIGFFVNTLALRTGLGGDPSFRALLARVREATLGAYQHQDVPFERLVEELQPERSLSHTPLFQVMFALQNVERGELRLGDLRAEPVAAADEEARFDLSLTLFEEGEGFAGALSWRTDLFAAATAERMAEHLRRLLEGVLRDPDAPVGSVALLAPAERDRLLAAGDRRGGFPREPVHVLFAGQARVRPGAVALSHPGGTVTYAELDRRADALARRLLEAGTGPEARVGIFLERSPGLVTAMLAALKAGGAYVPLDPAYPAERIAWMLEDAGVSVLVTEEGLRGRLPEFGGAVVVVGAEGTPLPPAPSPARGEGENGATADSLAYVIYTSGSTGTPKGVAVPHRAVVRLVRDTRYVDFSPDGVFLHLAPASFDAATFEVWGALLNGGRLVLPPPGAPTLEELEATVAREGVTTLWLTAGLFHVVVDERPGALAGVRQLLAGGDVLSPDHVRRALEALPGVRLVNGYGPTENTTFTTCHPVAPADLGGGSVPIGRPVAGTRVLVLDAALQPVPVGVPGELYAGGEGLARGYLGRPGPTAERFVPDPTGAEPGARLYRT